MLSIITPTYNSECFIDACLETVINQRCADLEHILIDGGSTDRTVEMIQHYANRYSHIRWRSEPDRGQSDAMNKGLTMAEGSIIGVLNVDDSYEPNTLTTIVDRFKTLPEPTLLVGNCNVWDNAGKLLEVNQPSKLSLFDLVVGVNINPYPCNPSAYFYHKSLHQIIGFYNPEDHYSMDLKFLLQAVQIANVVYVDQVWGNYHRLEGTKTVNDMKTGQTNQRVMQLLKRYRRNLPIVQQIQLILRDRWSTAAYFLANPQALPDALKTKLFKLSSALR